MRQEACHVAAWILGPPQLPIFKENPTSQPTDQRTLSHALRTSAVADIHKILDLSKIFKSWRSCQICLQA